MTKSLPPGREISERVEIKGHIIDSLTLPKVLDQILALGGEFNLEEIAIGKRKVDPSRAVIRVKAKNEAALEEILSQIRRNGAVLLLQEDVNFAEAPADGVFPEDFYSTTNLLTHVCYGGEWIEVEGTEMDCGIRLDLEKKEARTVPLYRARKGELYVVGHPGVRVTPVDRGSPRPSDFEFMASAVSSERPKALAIRGVAEEMRRARKEGGKILLVGGPAIVHTGATAFLVRLIERGFVNVLFAGNALAAHDIERAFFGTSLGVDLQKGLQAKFGHENHLRAINRIRAAGAIRKAVESGLLKDGILHACVRHGVEFVLAGSIRDDGPLPDVIPDVLQAQDAMRALIPGVSIALLVASTLHAVATGNLLPAYVKTVCVDINPAAVTKLADRGTFQALGFVTDAESFLRELARELDT